MSRKNLLFLLIFIAATVALVTVALFNRRDYQDTWILQDIVSVTAVYVLVFSFFAVACVDNRLLALGCASFIIVLNAIPNLKYDMLNGTFDSITHYGYAQNLVSLGHVPSTGFYASTYQDFPGMHILIGSLSIVTGLSVSAIIQLVTSLLVGIIPLMTYFATNRVFEPSIQRFIVVASGLPILTSYGLTGTTFAVPLFFSIICLILRSLLTENKRTRSIEHVIVSLMLVLGLLFSHAMTTLYLILSLLIAVLLLKFLSIKGKSVVKSYQNARVLVMGILMILLVSFAARLMFGSGSLLEILTDAGKMILTSHTTAGIVPGTFFKVPLSAKVIFLALSHIGDAVIVLMSCVGILVLFVNLRRKNREIYEKFYVFLLCVEGAILALLAAQFLLAFSGVEYERLVGYAIVLSPFLVGLFLWHLNNHLS